MRKNQIITVVFIAIIACIHTGCNEDNNNTSPATTMRTTQFDGAQGSCTSGGVKIEVLVDGAVDDAQTQFICNGANGQNGQNGQGGQSGTNTTMRTTPFTDAQGGCSNGGVKIEVLVDGTVDDTQTQYICNGTQGQGGQSGTNTTMRTTPFTDSQGGCTNGGIKFEVLVDGVVDDTQTQYICNRAQGQGGQSGTNTTMRTTPFEGAQGDCTNGGVKIEVLVNGTVDDTQTQYICNGKQGQGQSGTNTTMRTTPFEGAQGSCTNGGVKIEVLVDGVVDNVQTQYICNGAQGEQGEAGCSNGEKSCGGVCTDISTSITNCGSCSHNCNTSKPQHAMTMSCVDSQCTIAICEDGYILKDGQCVDCNTVAGWAKCSGKCVQTDTDSQNCGACNNKCTNGLTCANGKCVGNTTCAGVQVNTDSSLDHCGQCNNRCPDGKTCIDGKCIIGYGQAYCGGDIVQIGNIDRCGGCNDKCADGKICKDNACIDGAGPTYCDGKATNTMNDVSNCGSCGNRCENSICINGECVDGQGSYSTDEMYCNGKIIHYLSDSAHCNGCGNTCAVGFQCVAGTCQSNSFSILLTCDGISNINSKTDSANCGQCGHVCSSGKCRDGACLTYCNGYAVELMKDSANCGVCGKKCAVGEICTNGVCQTGAGDTYCSGVAINTSNDDLNCGKCSNACSGDLGCIRGTCELKYITFGHYEQDNDTTNGKEPITWRILDKNTEGQYLIISDKVLDVKPYDTKIISFTWEKSTIRSWLNGYAASYNTNGTSFTSDNFIDTAFTTEEKAKIVASNVPAHSNPNFSTSPGNATTDKIFLLSIVEANQYFTDDENRRAMATLSAVKGGVYSYNYDISAKCTVDNFLLNKCSAKWWLRSPGYTGDSAALVSYDGSDGNHGSHVNIGSIGVRPALWVNY